MLPLLYIVIPCYNAAAVLPFAVKFYEEKLDELAFCEKISTMSKILLVDNGSTDRTWETIVDISKKVQIVSGVKLGRYSGVDNALLCGFKEADRYCDIVIAANCFCRNDINAIDRMIEDYRKNSEIVFAKKEPSLFVRRLRGAFAKLGKTVKVRIDPEFFLISEKVIKELQKYTDFEIDIIKLVKNMNFRSSNVFYKTRNTFEIPRKICFKRIKEKFLTFFNSFSFPIHILMITGAILTTCLSVRLLVSLVFGALSDFRGIFLLFTVSLQLLFSGITGEYILKIKNEIKNHPKYTIIDRTETEK